MPRIHHITNGDATVALLSRADLPGTMSIWADILHEGPVPAGLSHEQLCVTRARYLADAGYGSYEDISTGFREWQAALDRPTYDELVLWFEHDLFDQLNLIQILDRLAARPRQGVVSLVSIDRFPGRQAFHGMGELEPADLASLFPARQPVGDAQLELATRAWAAFRSSTPAPLERLVDEDTSALPFLQPCLARHLEEFPGPRTGLSRTEHQMLELVRGGESDIRTLFARMREQERWFFIGDTSFWTLMLGLATSTPALLDVDVSELSSKALPKGHARLTAEGRSVLEGGADRVALCGIDRWLGGVHVTAGDNAWRRRSG